MAIRMLGSDMHVLTMRTRMPFRYGIATLTALPHLFLRIEVDVDGERRHGIAAEGLPPKWFTKNPETTFAQDLPEMYDVIRHAISAAKSIGGADTLWDYWRRIYTAQEEWARDKPYPPLLRAFGVTLVERALIDGYCRAVGCTFAEAVRQNRFGIRLGDLHEELDGFDPGDILPPSPLEKIVVRHTVGLSDPLTDSDIAPEDRADDGLPQSLEASIRDYGLTHFKIKLAGDPERDRARLRSIADVLQSSSHGEYAYTLDGNENYHEIEPFRELWKAVLGDPALSDFLHGLIFVEQPLHRDVALSDAAKDALLAWDGRPPMIIDESDGSLDSVRRALECGYVGTSHKNCKGVFKGIASTCLIRLKAKNEPDAHYVMSGEDLCNVGPVQLLEDLSALATLGIVHAERNGHHYYKGLSMFSDSIQRDMLADHGDLYRRHRGGFATLSVRDGAIAVGSVVGSPFGPKRDIDPTAYTPLDEWDPAELDA